MTSERMRWFKMPLNKIFGPDLQHSIYPFRAYVGALSTNPFHSSGIMMRFAHVSDFHLTSTPEKSSVVRNDVEAAIDTLIADLRSIESFLDFVAITGDLTEFADSDSYLKIRKHLETFSIPVYVIPGNHDAREPFHKALSPVCPMSNQGTLDFSTRSGMSQIIGLDTLIEGEVSGRLSDEQIDWFVDTLDTDQYTHTVVMMHHPPFATGLREFDEISGIEGHERFSQVIAALASKVTVLSGHVHRPYQAHWNGASCYIAGSPAFQIGGEHPFGDCVLGSVSEPFAYLIHTLTETGDHLVNTRYVAGL